MPSPITTFTWTASNGGTLTADWATGADWSPVATGANFSASQSGTVSAFLVNGTANLDLTGLGSGGQTVNALTVTDPNATLTAGTSGLTVGNMTLTAGVFVGDNDDGQLTVGNGSAGILNIGSNGTLEIGGSDPNDGYTVDGGTGGGSLTGSGTVIAIGGQANFGPNMAVASGQSLTFDIDSDSGNPAVLYFQNNVNSGDIDFLGPNGLLVLSGSQIGNGTHLSGDTFGATIAGLDASSTETNAIDLNDGSTPTGAMLANVTSTSAQLKVTDGTATDTFNLTGDYIGDTASIVANPNYGFDIFLVCYGAGTAVLTDKGEVAVETIQTGDALMTLVDGALRPQTVKWVGHRAIALNQHPNPTAVAPIRIMRGALGENLPRRDLILSPDHCLFIDGALFPAKLLVNEMTITRDLSRPHVSYHHIELERHSVMFAEGVAAETYLDTGNRAFFANAGLATILHPELTINENLRCWETDACAKLTVEPELVKPVWLRFAERAATMGFNAPVHTTTDSADIRLVVNGRTLNPLADRDGKVSFVVPAGAKTVRLVSRATRPSALKPWLDDPRTLGVAIRSITVRGPFGESVIGADHPALRDGWHAAERANGTLWRWTMGDAALPIVSSGPCAVEIAISDTTTYIDRTERLAA